MESVTGQILSCWEPSLHIWHIHTGLSELPLEKLITIMRHIKLSPYCTPNRWLMDLIIVYCVRLNGMTHSGRAVMSAGSPCFLVSATGVCPSSLAMGTIIWPLNSWRRKWLRWEKPKRMATCRGVSLERRTERGRVNDQDPSNVFQIRHAGFFLLTWFNWRIKLETLIYNIWKHFKFYVEDRIFMLSKKYIKI